MDPLEPLLTWLNDNPDYSDQDYRQECDRLFTRQVAVDRMLRGELPADYVLDMLDSHGVDAARYADLAIGNLERAVNEQMEFDPETVQIYLPG